MNNLPDISIITINYNGIRVTCELLESLLSNLGDPDKDIPENTEQEKFRYEIIVVDNGSASDESREIKRLYPSVQCIRSERNLGFSGGNNLGIKAAGGNYILLMNNDTFIEDNSLHYLLETLRSNPKTGAVSPKIKFAAPPRDIQFAGYTALSVITLRNRLIGFGESDKGQYDTPSVTPYLHGAAMLIKREVIEKTGLMPEIYFLYYEELDWCTRMAAHGYELWYEPRCTVFHKESQTVGQESPLRTFYITRNRLLYGWRNRNGFRRILTVLYQCCVAGPKNFFTYSAKRQWNLAKAVIKGNIAFFKLKYKTE